MQNYIKLEDYQEQEGHITECFGAKETRHGPPGSGRNTPGNALIDQSMHLAYNLIKIRMQHKK